ncbi:hypothetical protein ACLI4U_09690 [Natrialbaceae archaeon A-CW2]
MVEVTVEYIYRVLKTMTGRISADVSTSSTTNTYIEFLGPPGAGKSTIYRDIVTKDTIQAISEETSFQEYFLSISPFSCRFLYQVMPRRIQKKLNIEVLRYRLYERSLAEYVQLNPDFLSVLAKIFEQNIPDSNSLFTQFCRSASRYQMAKTVASCTDIICIDEGFTQRLAAARWRADDQLMPIMTYLTMVRKPDIIIHIDAPSDICLHRQRERGNVIVSTKGEEDPIVEQRQFREMCDKVSKQASNSGVKVLKFENMGDPSITSSKCVDYLINST